MQHGNARPLAVKYISDHGRRHSDQGEPSSVFFETEAGLRGRARCAKGDAERARQVGGLFQINRFVAGHVFKERLIRPSDADCRLVEKHQTLQIDLAHAQIRRHSARRPAVL